MTCPTDVWNSLEITKLVVSAMMPIAVVFLGAQLQRRLREYQRSQDRKELANRWRQDILNELIPSLNALYCYFMYVGDWDSMSPMDAIDAKHRCDRLVQMNRFLWSQKFLEDYEQLMKAAFVECRGRGLRTLLKANRARHRECAQWNESWSIHFVDPSRKVERSKFKSLYESAIMQAVRDLGIIA